MSPLGDGSAASVALGWLRSLGGGGWLWLWVSAGGTTLGDGDGGRAGGEVALGGDDLVVVGAQVQAVLGPGSDVVGEGDGSGGTLVAADGPVLLEGGGANDGWLLGTGGDEEIVDGAVGGDGATGGGTGGWVVGTEVLNDVVLDEWVLGPSVDGEVGVAVGVVLGSVGDDSVDDVLVGLLFHHCRACRADFLPVGGSWHPSLTTDQVTTGSPGDGVLSTWAVGVGSSGSVVGPPGEVESVVGTGSGWGSSTLAELTSRADGNVVWLSSWGSDGAGESSSGEEERADGNHFEYVVEDVEDLEELCIEWSRLLESAVEAGW